MVDPVREKAIQTILDEISPVRDEAHEWALATHGSTDFAIYRYATYLQAVLQDARTRADTLERSLRKIAHFPFDVTSDAEIDLRTVKRIAAAALPSGKPTSPVGVALTRSEVKHDASTEATTSEGERP